MRALLATTGIETKLFLREPLTVVFTLVLPMIFMFVLGEVFAGTEDPALFGGADPVEYSIPGWVALVWTAVGLMAMPVHLARYREDGVLRRLLATPAPRYTAIGAQLAVGFATALVGGVLVIVLASLVHGTGGPQSPPAFVGAWLLCGALFSALGLLLACIPSARGALGAGLGLFFVMLMLSGTGPPAAMLTGPVHWVSNAMPLTYVLRLLQGAWLGLPWSWGDTAVVAGFVLAAVAGWRLLFRWE